MEQTDWEKAAADFGAASVNSMRTMHSAILRKIADAGGKIDSQTGAVTPVSKKGNRSATKVKVGKKGAGNDDDTDNSPNVVKTPRKKKPSAKPLFEDLDAAGDQETPTAGITAPAVSESEARVKPDGDESEAAKITTERMVDSGRKRKSALSREGPSKTRKLESFLKAIDELEDEQAPIKDEPIDDMNSPSSLSNHATRAFNVKKEAQ